MFQTSDQWFLSWETLPDLSNQVSFSPLNAHHILNFTFISRMYLHIFFWAEKSTKGGAIFGFAQYLVHAP